MRALALALLSLAACAAPDERVPIVACEGKCDGAVAAWASLSSLPAAEQALVRADLDRTPTRIDLDRWLLHRHDAGAFRVYWADAAPRDGFDGPRPEMLSRLVDELARARARFLAMGFTLPAQVRVYVAEEDGEATQANGSVSLGHDVIELDLPRAIVNGWQADDEGGAVSATPVHELFHVAQYHAYATLSRAPTADWHPSNVWITEATAVYMEALLVAAPQPWRAQYAPWTDSLPLLGLGCAGSCKKEWYQRGAFFRFLAAAGLVTDHADLWARLVTEADLTQPGAATAFLDAYVPGGGLASWARFAAAYELGARDAGAAGLEGPVRAVAPQSLDPEGGAPIWSVDLWPVGGTRAAALGRAPSPTSALVLDTIDPTLAHVRGLVYAADGAPLGELVAGGPPLPLHGERVSLVLTSTEPRAHTTARLSIVTP